jgi:NAD(P)-dependent dehydrogenase (short-subunit alcohol dehydrogenase family)
VRAEVLRHDRPSAGVGRATVRGFARRGARLGLIARGRDRLQAIAREVERLSGQALVLPGDVSDPARIEEAAAEVEARFGSIDVWINNAMVSVFSPVQAVEAAEYRRVIEVTYLGVVHGTLAALRRMRPRDRGVIVQVGSALAYRAIPLQSAYCAAKHAVAGFTESQRAELLHDQSHVRLTIVHLPALNTPQFEWARSRLPRRVQPVPPIFQPEVAAGAIVWASHHPAARGLGWRTDGEGHHRRQDCARPGRPVSGPDWLRGPADR